MTTFFVTCAALGGAVLILQFVLGFIGMEHGSVHLGHLDHAADGLSLRSVRALSAGLAFFGLGGLTGLQLGLGAMVAVPIALIAGGAAMYGVASLMRSFRRLEADGTLSVYKARGVTGSVYLGIPPERSGAGKVHVVVQNRFVELAAVTPYEALPTGTPVLVIDVEPPETVVVVRNPSLLEDPDASH